MSQWNQISPALTQTDVFMTNHQTIVPFLIPPISIFIFRQDKFAGWLIAMVQFGYLLTFIPR